MDLPRISRYISLILRHKPWVAGITLDHHGWADVEELLAGVSKKYPIDKGILEEIVRTDNKQRYSFNENKTKIRANQGHSIPVDVELHVVTPPPILYLYVHLSGDAMTARKVGQRHGRSVIYNVASGEMAKEGYTFYRSVNGVWLTKKVPPRFLTWYAAPISDHEGR